MRANVLMRFCSLVVSGTAVLLQCDAQAQTITINNTSLSPIPLTGSVTVDSAGQLSATCAGTTCSSLGQSAGNPASVNLPDGPLSATQNAATNIAMTVANSPIACVGTSSTTAVSGWLGNDLRITSGNVAVTFVNSGTHTLTANCVNNDGSAGVDTVSVVVASDSGGGSTGDFDNCVLPGAAFSTDLNNTALQRPAGYELVKPVGMIAYNRTWESQWNAFSWPNPNSQLSTIGSWSALVTGAWSGSASAYPRTAVAAGSYITMSFEVTAAHAGTYPVEWTEAQPQTGSYSMSRVTNELTLTISPCAGDLRPKNPSGPDKYVKYCRVGNNASTSGSFAFDVSATGGSTSCNLAPGKYWLTIAMARSAQPDFVSGPRNGCRDNATSCEANFKFR